MNIQNKYTIQISVVVPVYNGADYLRRCIESIQQQQLDAMEIIVVDDGSTDGTHELLLELAAADPRIVPIFQENAGVSVARNTALARCRGTYVSFVDSDDLLPENAIQPLVEALETTGADIAIAGYRENLGGRITERCLVTESGLLPIHDFLAWMHPKSNSFFVGVLWNKLFRRKLIQNGGVRFQPDVQWGEDFRFVMDYLAISRSVYLSTHMVYEYVRNPHGMTVHQALDCCIHPIANCKLKYGHYLCMRGTYIRQNIYHLYKKKLWLFLFRFTLRN